LNIIFQEYKFIATELTCYNNILYKYSK
jgi:hypothetical protein